MSANLDALVEGIRAKRSEKLPQAKARLEKLKAAKEAVLTTRTRAAAVAANNPDLQAKLCGIEYSQTLRLLDEAILSNKNAMSRLQRESINIGVAGKSGQGKSQILQMLTGLDDRQIPTGGGTACTAARSIVHNGQTSSARVHYLTKDGLLSKKVYPSYEPRGKSTFALGLSTPRPATLEDFLSMKLPCVETSDGTPTEAEDNWQKVLDLQRVMRSHPELVAKLGTGEEMVDLARVRDYIVKDNGETLHNVVDYVEITTCFEIGLPVGLTVYDLPGLADPTPGIREDMFASLKNDADIVLFLRKASTDGERELWRSEDNEAIDLMKSVYKVEDVQPAEWIQLVLNLDSRSGHVNVNNTETLRKTVTRGFVPVVCDCGKKEAVRAMVNDNIERLVKNVERIDNLRINQADVSFDAAMGEVRALYDALRNASGDVLAQESGFDFERHLLSFMYGLRDPFKKDIAPVFRNSVREILSRHFKEAETMLGQIYDANESAEDFPPELPVFSRMRLRQEFGAGDGPAGVVEKAVRNQREAVLKLLRDHLAKCCDELVACYYDCVVKTGFASNPSLNCILPVGDGTASSYVRLEQFLVAVRASGSFPSIESALEGVLRLELTFDNSILPALYSISELDDFNPDLPPEAKKEGSHELDDIKAYLSNDIHDSGDRATAFSNWLRQKSESILSCVTSGSASSPLFQISEHIANTMRANYDAFVFRFIWGEMTTNEWRRLADRNKAIFWKEEFDKAAANSQIAKDWQSAIAGLASAL